MTYGVIYNVSHPIELYDRVATEVDTRWGGGGSPEGLIVHIARPTRSGFQIVEVWRSRADADRFMQVVGPIIVRDAEGQPRGRDRQNAEEFEVRRLRLGG